MNGSRFAFLTLWNGSYESQIGNDRLTWEKANKYNLGLEIGLFNMFRIEADAFFMEPVGEPSPTLEAYGEVLRYSLMDSHRCIMKAVSQ